MKKLFFLVLTVLIVSCSSDDDNTSEVVTCDESKIVGTWDNQVLFEGETIESWILNSNGTGNYYNFAINEITEITWSVNESVLSTNIVFEGLEAPFLDFNYSFSSNCDVMNLQADASEDFPDGYNFNYDRR
jgi:hypothetical protein